MDEESAEFVVVVAGGGAFPKQLAGFLIHLDRLFFVLVIHCLDHESGGLHEKDAAGDSVVDVNLL